MRCDPIDMRILVIAIFALMISATSSATWNSLSTYSTKSQELQYGSAFVGGEVSYVTRGDSIDNLVYPPDSLKGRLPPLHETDRFDLYFYGGAFIGALVGIVIDKVNNQPMNPGPPMIGLAVGAGVGAIAYWIIEK